MSSRRKVRRTVRHGAGEFHGTDKTCRNANDRSRFIYNDEVLNDLLFPINDINGNRYRLCDSCFFGGPLRLSLRSL